MKGFLLTASDFLLMVPTIVYIVIGFIIGFFLL